MKSCNEINRELAVGIQKLTPQIHKLTKNSTMNRLIRKTKNILRTFQLSEDVFC